MKFRELNLDGNLSFVLHITYEDINNSNVYYKEFVVFFVSIQRKRTLLGYNDVCAHVKQSFKTLIEDAFCRSLNLAFCKNLMFFFKWNYDKRNQKKGNITHLASLELKFDTSELMYRLDPRQYRANGIIHIDYVIESATYGFLFTSCKTLENERVSAANEWGFQSFATSE